MIGNIHKNLNKTDIQMTILMLITVSLSVINAYLTPLYQFRYIVATILMIVLFLIVHFSSKNRKVLIEISVIGLIAGFVELLADYFLVLNAGLKYNTLELFILESPFYMPFAWSFIIIQLGYVGYRLYDGLGKIKGTLITGFIGSIYVGLAEMLAHNGNLWKYSQAPLSYIHHSPLYIILGEGLMFSLLVLLLREDHIFDLDKIPRNYVISRNIVNKGLFKGTLFGFIIFLSYVTTFYSMTLLSWLI
ncbi:MAG: hypothetical protein ABEK17_02595 [Candidatus Aenigmatarchaeota archaeon]